MIIINILIGIYKGKMIKNKDDLSQKLINNQIIDGSETNKISIQWLRQLFTVDNLLSGRSYRRIIDLGGLNILSDIIETDLKNGIAGTSVDISNRQTKYGTNKLIKLPEYKNYWKFLMEYLHLGQVSHLLIVTLISIIINFCMGQHFGQCILILIIVGSLAEYYAFYMNYILNFNGSNKILQRQTNLQYINLIKSISSQWVDVKRKGITSRIKITQCLLGDVVVVRQGGIIPADGVVLQQQNFTIRQYGFIQKQNKLAYIQQKQHKNSNNNSHKYFVSCLSYVTSGTATIVLLNIGFSQWMGQLQKQNRLTQRKQKTFLKQKITSMQTYFHRCKYFIFVLVIGVLFVKLLWEKIFTSQSVGFMRTVLRIIQIYQIVCICLVIGLVHVPISITPIAKKLTFLAKTFMRTGKCMLANRHMRIKYGYHHNKKDKNKEHHDRIVGNIQCRQPRLQILDRTYSVEMERIVCIPAMRYLEYNQQQIICEVVSAIRVSISSDNKGDSSNFIIMLSVCPYSTRIKTQDIDQFLCMADFQDIFSYCSSYIDSNGVIKSMNAQFIEKMKELVTYYQLNRSCRSRIVCYKQVSKLQTLFDQSQKYKFLQSKLIFVSLINLHFQIYNGVPDYIRLLTNNKMKVKMLSGNSLQTCISIAKQANILPNDFQLTQDQQVAIQASRLLEILDQIGFDKQIDYDYQEYMQRLRKFVKNVKVIARITINQRRIFVRALKKVGTILGTIGIQDKQIIDNAHVSITYATDDENECGNVIKNNSQLYGMVRLLLSSRLLNVYLSKLFKLTETAKIAAIVLIFLYILFFSQLQLRFSVSILLMYSITIFIHSSRLRFINIRATYLEYKARKIPILNQRNKKAVYIIIFTQVTTFIGLSWLISRNLSNIPNDQYQNQLTKYASMLIHCYFFFQYFHMISALKQNNFQQYFPEMNSFSLSQFSINNKKFLLSSLFIYFNLQLIIFATRVFFGESAHSLSLITAIIGGNLYLVSFIIGLFIFYVDYLVDVFHWERLWGQYYPDYYQHLLINQVVQMIGL